MGDSPVFTWTATARDPDRVSASVARSAVYFGRPWGEHRSPPIRALGTIPVNIDGSEGGDMATIEELYNEKFAGSLEWYHECQ